MGLTRMGAIKHKHQQHPPPPQHQPPQRPEPYKPNKNMQIFIQKKD